MPDRSVSRREFTQQLTAGTSLALVSWTAAAGQEPAGPPVKPPQKQDARTEPSPELPPPEPEEYLLAALIQQYPGEHLTPEMLAGIRADLRRNRRQGELLRTVALGNSDEPATVFRAWRKE
jgi:hypothetical protein